jgi:hypothetical protein
MWSVVMWSELMWCMWSDFIFKWIELKWVTVKFLKTKVPCTLRWHIEVTWLYCFYLFWEYLVLCFNLYCGCLTCFVMSGCVYVWVLWCVDILVTRVLAFTVFCIVGTVFFVLFRLCIFILICFGCTSVRTTATEWKLRCS